MSYFKQETATMLLVSNGWLGVLLGIFSISDLKHRFFHDLAVSLGLKLRTVRIPQYKFRSESALLECHYELKGPRKGHSSLEGNNRRHHGYQNDYLGDHYGEDEEKLYSIKWYKDNEEFYRYVPSASQPIKSYKIEGIRVDPNHSDGTKVLLRALTLKSSGIYRCEISAEAPSFESVQGEGRLDVIYVPKDGPHINDSERKNYHIGETMELNCTSGRSYPASTLQWYLNDVLVTDPNNIIHYPSVQNQHGLITTFLGLSMVINHRHYIDGTIRIKCVASLSPVLWRGGQESIVQWEQPPIDNRVAMLLVKSVGNVLLLHPCLIVVSLFLYFRISLSLQIK